MRKIYFIYFFSLFPFQFLAAQNTFIRFEFKNVPTGGTRFMVYDRLGAYDPIKKETVILIPDSQGMANYAVSLTEPQFMKLGFVLNAEGSDYISYVLFLTPGDQLLFKTDFKNRKKGFKITGKGAENNQAIIQKLIDINLERNIKDTLPDNALIAIQKQQVANKTILKNYIDRYRPSKSFIRNYEINLKYFPIATYYEYKEDNKHQKYAAYLRNYKIWEGVEKDMLKSVKLNNDQALFAYNYVKFVSQFVSREKERGWDLSSSNPAFFYKRWYNTDVESGSKTFMAEQNSLFVEKVINRYFSGKTAEFLYASLIKDNLYRKRYENLNILLSHFDKRYPGSFYLNWFETSKNQW